MVKGPDMLEFCLCRLCEDQVRRGGGWELAQCGAHGVNHRLITNSGDGCDEGEGEGKEKKKKEKGVPLGVGSYKSWIKQITVETTTVGIPQRQTDMQGAGKCLSFTASGLSVNKISKS